MTDFFDDSRLDDADALAEADEALRHLAEAGARVRRELVQAEEAVPQHDGDDRPRAVVVAGSDARLLRAVLEPWCPVPFVAWPAPGLPGWAGPLDLVVVLAPQGEDEVATATAGEAARRGCRLVLSVPEASPLADLAGGRHHVLLPSATGDALAAAVVALRTLHRLGLGPDVAAEDVAAALDEVAIACAPQRPLGDNPAKDLAVVLADSVPLVWGGTVLAARAGRRVVEAVRRASGRAALAADARHLLPVLEGAPPRDPFADPFADGDPAARPALVVLDDGSDEAVVRVQRSRLLAAAEANDVRSQTLSRHDTAPVARYAALLAEGLWAASYLGLGLGRPGRDLVAVVA
ncbi:MAG: hypothetical protein ACTHNT_03595 [Actinomycetales bacterium]